MITVLTPTFNREHTLERLYKSLLKQKYKDFEWLIIDDGSIDNTESLIKKLSKDNKIKINYYKKKNGGKHKALNYAYSKIKGDYVIIVDSDDSLENNSLETINKYIEKYKDNQKIASFSFYRRYDNKDVISSTFDKEIISNNIEFRYNQNRPFDMAEVYKTKVLKQYKFPEIENEKFLSEAIVWNRIALNYDTVYIPKSIYICYYQEEGLSNNYWKLVYNNPLGAALNSNFMTRKEFKLKKRIEESAKYVGYSYIGKVSLKNIIKESNNKPLTILMLLQFPLLKYFLKYKIKQNKKVVETEK